MSSLYVNLPLDPSSLKAADDREYREALAASSIVSVTRVSAEELRVARFWADVDAKRKQEPKRTLKLVRNA